VAPEDRVFSGVWGILAALVEIFHRDSGQLLAYCYLGEDLMVERIADILGSKYLGAAAMELREMARIPPLRNPPCSSASPRSSSPTASKRLFG
jgi:hypothetical protein